MTADLDNALDGTQLRGGSWPALSVGEADAVSGALLSCIRKWMKANSIDSGGSVAQVLDETGQDEVPYHANHDGSDDGQATPPASPCSCQDAHGARVAAGPTSADTSPHRQQAAAIHSLLRLQYGLGNVRRLSIPLQHKCAVHILTIHVTPLDSLSMHANMLFCKSASMLRPCVNLLTSVAACFQQVPYAKGVPRTEDELAHIQAHAQLTVFAVHFATAEAEAAPPVIRRPDWRGRPLLLPALDAPAAARKTKAAPTGFRAA